MMQLVQALPKVEDVVDSSAKAEKHRLLMALSVEEMELFFSGMPDISGLGISSVEWCRTERLSPEEWSNRLEASDPTVILSCWSTPCLPAARDRVASLGYVCHLTGSVRHVVPRELILGGVQVTNWGALVGEAVAEHALLLALAAQRNLSQWIPVLKASPSSLRQKRWALKTMSMRGRRVGIHGFGAVARSLIELLRPFGVKLTVFSEGVPPALIENCGATPCLSVESLFSRSEVLFECEALTEKTRGMVTEEVLAFLAPDSIFVNVGRGAVVDERALAAIAAGGRIRVALDVFEDEVPGSDSPLWQIPSAVLSPHIAGPTRDQYEICGHLALENLQRFCAGQMLKNVISREIYDYST